MSGPQNLQATELTGASPRTKQYPPRIRSFITYVQAQYWSPFFILHNLLKTKHGTCRLLKFTLWLLLVRTAKVKPPPYFGVNKFEDKLQCGKYEAPTGWLDWEVSSSSSHISTDTWNPLQTLVYQPRKHT